MLFSLLLERLKIMKKKNKQLRNLLVCLAVILAVVAVLGTVVVVDARLNDRPAEDLTCEEAQKIVNDAFSALPNNVADGAQKLDEYTEIKVNNIKHGENRELILSCTYKTKNIKKLMDEHLNELLCSVVPVKGKAPMTEAKIKLFLSKELSKLIDEEEEINGEVTIYLYETVSDGFQVYFSDELVNTVYGGLLDAHKKIENTTEIFVKNEDGSESRVDISRDKNIRVGCTAGIALVNYSSDKPDTASFVGRTWNDFTDDFYRNFIYESRWTYLVKGLGTTLAITALSLILGVVIGVVVAIVRTTCAKTGKLKIPDKICNVYLSIMRGTPVMVQLMIIYFVLLLPIGIEKFPAAVICFGVNSGAYVAEIIRGGIMSVDDGQTEAGRSLGLGYISTMWHIVIPQAFKAILPSLANEFITLLKETSVAFYIGVADLTQGGLKIRSLTYSNFMPLIAVALVYLVLVLGLSYLVSLLERRLRKSDRR